MLEVLESQLAAFGIHAGVIRNRLQPSRRESGGPLLHGAARARVDQHSPAGGRHGLQHQGQRIGRAQLHAIHQVGATGRTHLNQRPAQLQQTDDVGPHLGGGGGTERHQGHPRALGAQLPQAAVVGAEIVAPGADAVGFIHRQGHQLTALEHVVEQLAGGLRLEPLGRQIEQAQLVIPQALQQLPPLRQRQAAVQTGRRDAAALQLAHLVLHQGNQG